MPTENDLLAVVQDLETKRRAAMVSKDLNVLASLLDEDLTYVHSTGRLMNKTEYLDHVASEEFSYVRANPLSVERYSVTEQMILLVQQIDSEIQTHGRNIAGVLSTVSVWRLSHGEWKLVGSAASRVSD